MDKEKKKRIEFVITSKNTSETFDFSKTAKALGRTRRHRGMGLVPDGGEQELHRPGHPRRQRREGPEQHLRVAVILANIQLGEIFVVV